MKVVARIAMLLSLSILIGALLYVWLPAVWGDAAAFWQGLGLNQTSKPIPDWVPTVGLATGLNAVFALGYCYWAVSKVLSAEGEALFHSLALALRRLSNGLIYFWISYGTAVGLVPLIAIEQVVGLDIPYMEGNLNPFGINSVFLVLGLAFRPIAAAMLRAERVAAENRGFV